MVRISSDIKNMIEEQDFIVLGTVDKYGIPNVSPRSTFHVTSKAVYWFELFKHKSFSNFQDEPWVSVSVFDKSNLTGYQLKGKVSIVQDKEEFFFADQRISNRLEKQKKKKIIQKTKNQNYKIIKFTPKIIYSLNPVEFSDMPGLIEADPEIGRLVSNVNFEKLFGLKL